MLYGRFEPGPWHMGKLSFWVNLWAVLWTAFVSVIFLFPTFYPVTADNMNYAIVIMGAIFVASGVYWVISGRKFYVGPISETQILEGVETEKEKERMKNDGGSSAPSSSI